MFQFSRNSVSFVNSLQPLKGSNIKPPYRKHRKHFTKSINRIKEFVLKQIFKVFMVNKFCKCPKVCPNFVKV